MARDHAEFNNAGMTDEELVLLAQQGDKEAEQTVILRYMPLVKMKSRPYFLIGADKEDLVQEGSIGLIAAVRDFDREKGAGFRSFAEVCITNNVLAAIKRASRKKHLPLNESVSLDKPISEEEDGSVTLGDRLEQSCGSNPEELAIIRESETSFTRALEKELTELEMSVLTLFLNGHSYKAIADRLGKSTKAVDNALQRVKRKAAALLEQDE